MVAWVIGLLGLTLAWVAAASYVPGGPPGRWPTGAPADRSGTTRDGRRAPDEADR